MASYRVPSLRSGEITPESVYFNRRKFMVGAIASAAAFQTGQSFASALDFKSGDFSTDEKQTAFEDITNFNNFYEFGTGKGDPAARSLDFRSEPWSIEVTGLVAKPKRFDLDELRKFQLEERIYRMRCVEAWSMVIPWLGFPLSALIDAVEPLGSAKYVAFETVVRPEEMPGQRGLFQAMEWPYVEGLRLDEARHPLTILSLGLYGRELLAQNGAPVRLVVPWKYGFKGIKSIVKITLTEAQPVCSWQRMAPHEYGFYANVNPEVDHPRWSQATEIRIGEGGFFKPAHRPTLPFNGYGDEVASLYSGLDLSVDY